MKEVTNFSEVNQLLAQFVPNIRSEVSYTLERMLGLMDYLGNPQDKLKVIHVAGTSGKTSTSYYIASLLKATGKKVGLTVSPHVVSVADRVQFDLTPLDEPSFCKDLNQFMALIEKSQIVPSYFELLVAFAFWEFERHGVDYAVVEVGLGGLLDGTNVINRDDKVCVITDIGLDHINVLGNSLTEIAAQKAGIIQDNNVIFAYRQKPEVNEVITKKANEKAAALNFMVAGDIETDFSFLPLFQQRNFVLAQAVTDYVIHRDHLKPLNVSEKAAAAKVAIPARMETFRVKDKIVILDGAHNAQKLNALTSSISAANPNKTVAAIISFVDGRGFRLKSSLKVLSKFLSHAIITSFTHTQDLPHGAVEPKILAELFEEYGYSSYETVVDPGQALTRLLKRPETVLLITGSFYLLNDIRPKVLALI